MYYRHTCRALLLLLISVPMLGGRSIFAQQLPELKGPFSLEFECTASDPRTRAQFMQDEAAFRSDLREEVKGGRLAQVDLDQMLARRVNSYELLRKGVHSRLTLSSDGQRLVGLQREGSSLDAPINRGLIVTGNRLYAAIISDTAIPTSLKVTSPGMFSSYENLPFLGVRLPGLPPLVEFDAQNKPARTPILFHVKLILSPANAFGKPGQVAARATYAADSHSPTGVLKSIVVGSPQAITLQWDLSGYAMYEGVLLPTSIRLLRADSPGMHHPSQQIAFRLKSFNKKAIAAENFNPEHFLQEKSVVQDDSPNRSGKPLVFEYRSMGSSLESQTKDHETLEVGLNQRENREQTPSNSYAGIFGIVGIAVVGAGLFSLSRLRTKRNN